MRNRRRNFLLAFIRIHFVVRGNSIGAERAGPGIDRERKVRGNGRADAAATPTSTSKPLRSSRMARVTLEPNRVVLTFPASGYECSPERRTPRPRRRLPRRACPEILRAWPSPNWRRCASGGEPSARSSPTACRSSGTWPQDYHDRVEANLGQVGVAASTAADQDAMQLLQNEFSNLSRWASDVVSTRQSLNATNTVRPDTMQNDPALAKISNCSRFLSSMLVSGMFADDQSCH